MIDREKLQDIFEQLLEKTPKNNLGQIYLQDFINVVIEAEIVLISKI